MRTLGGRGSPFPHNCHSAKLAIELDGLGHYSKQGLAHDAERSSILLNYGIHVLRFSHLEVEPHFEEVCTIINQQIQKMIGNMV